jgi:hypothetical protein
VVARSTQHRWRRAAGAIACAAGLVAAGCSKASFSSTHILDPPASLPAAPDYTAACSPSGPDVSPPCLQVTLKAIDDARAKEHLGPLALPSDYATLSVPEQLLVVLDGERVDRGLHPFVGLSAALSASDATAAAASHLPPTPGRPYANADTEWIGDVSNALDADYEWMYDDGPGSVDGCSHAGDSECWADRHIVLDDFGSDAPGGQLVLGAAFDPSGDTTSGDVGGTSLAATFATTTRAEPLSYTWARAQADMAAGVLPPVASRPANQSATHIPDPSGNVSPNPDYIDVCAPSGLDSSAPCLDAALAALNAARALEGVKPMVLPAGYGQLSVADQTFVAVNLERVDRGLPPFTALTAALNANAQIGANDANDPPDPGGGYRVVDTEWAGGSSNGLDAVYGWMYDDGIGSGNLDCPKKGGSGCWGHRHGLLDDFGTVGTMVMGAAVNPTGDTGVDRGGPSIGATLAVTSKPIGATTFTWAQVLATLPAGP